MRNKLILASASPRRASLLKQIHITPDEISAADIDESELKGEKPKDCAQRLALQKAKAVHKPSHFTLGADTIVAVGTRMLPKTETPEQAQQCLKMLSGRRHHVIGGIALITPDNKEITRTVDTVVQFKQLTPTEINDYLESKEWQGIAGGYAIQGLAASFIKSLRGSYSNVVGLSLYDTMNMLKGNGFE
ncbi:Maf family nucleotide pyrophosphatase [Alphaproteobacteria bacterium]|nr:Maf family nucleotide pyrophosphatase [Alphaproteobacteria bacterium]